MKNRDLLLQCLGLLLLAVVAAYAANRAYGDTHYTNHWCMSITCSDVEQLGGTSCVAGVWCRSRDNVNLFDKCMPSSGLSCDELGSLGVTTCQGTCQDQMQGHCSYDLGRCQPP
jgi:hypothetical protein